MRSSRIERNTNETQIVISLNIDGKGRYDIETGIGFLDHMLGTFAKHGLFDVDIRAKGDLNVDQHHLVEDLGITLGKAFDKALGERMGINRTGYFVFPMDESLAVVSVDISGRPSLLFRADFKRRMIGELDSDLFYDFFKGFADSMKGSLAIRVLEGRNDHHKAESIFKAFARAMRMACSEDPRMIDEIPSTKGLIE
ncbi:MAG TPA: imidazoleglycerol-phosphate dehydratase HisB [Candidatus Methanofastidiosa archaeon]|nr:imidazoleglycerol-phosphate dehydratase HisB [Candidatus Methanofastidiosa archaeon]HPR41372.1 imidazoleglycerol-phosphate dehydratase HisB [Candidatus Methanofastidiosa archaeon]